MHRPSSISPTHRSRVGTLPLPMPRCRERGGERPFHNIMKSLRSAWMDVWSVWTSYPDVVAEIFCARTKRSFDQTPDTMCRRLGVARARRHDPVNASMWAEKAQIGSRSRSRVGCACARAWEALQPLEDLRKNQGRSKPYPASPQARPVITHTR